MSIGAVPQPGEIVAGKYEVVRFLGKGGMGLVLEARHRKLGHRVALKLLLPDTIERTDAVARFEREARAAAQLRSQHVVRVLDVDNDAARGGLPFIVMEYLDGRDLANELRRRPILPLPEAVDLMLQACMAFAEAHANGIVHRDIKPSNLFLEGRSPRVVLKVMDFGVAKLVATPEETELTTTETALGTPSYMAPEQLMSSKTIDHRADIWALGVVAYRMLSGRLPFTADSAASLAVAIVTVPPVHLANAANGLPPAVANAIMSALERDVSRRPQDAVAFGRLLAPYGTGSIPFEASVAGLVAPVARSSEPRIGSTPDVTERRVSQPDPENANTANAWSQRDGARVPPAAASPPYAAMLAIGAGSLVLGVIGLVLAFGRMKPPADASVTKAPASAVATQSDAPPPAALPPAPATGATLDPEPPRSASSVARPSAKPVQGPARSAQPAGSTRPTATPSAAPAPTKDPLHL